jgi:hypothetical protein
MTRSLVAFAVVLSLGGCGSEDASARFQRMQWSLGGGPCTEEMDCSGFYELRADGTFRVDRFNEYGGGVHEATLPTEEREALVERATDPALLKVLRRGPYPCGRVTDFSSGLTVELEGERLQAELAGCDEPSVQALREELRRLDETYLKQ